MGCGLVSQRGPSAVEVHQPLALDGVSRATGSRLVIDDSGAHTTNTSSSSGGGHHGSREARGHGPRHEERSAHDDRFHGRSTGRGGGHGAEEAGSHGRQRRFVAGERVVLAGRVPGYAQDHAFCFECGTFFHIGSQRAAQCSRCGSTFVQFLRHGGNEHWLSADTAAGVNFTYEDQLDNSITASLDAAPVKKAPTQDKYVKGLPITTVTEEEEKARQGLDEADPKRRCAICREAYTIGCKLKQLPCSHEFHNDCIAAWLKTQNTCPICRWRLPEALEGDEAEAEDVEVLKCSRPWLDADEGTDVVSASPQQLGPRQAGAGEQDAVASVASMREEMAAARPASAGRIGSAAAILTSDPDSASSPDMSGVAAEMSVPGTPIPMESPAAS